MPPYRCNSFVTVISMVFVNKERINSLIGTGMLEHTMMISSNVDFLPPCQFPHVAGYISVILGRGGPMRSHLCAATPVLYVLWFTMAQVAGQEDREKTTALKGK